MQQPVTREEHDEQSGTKATGGEVQGERERSGVLANRRGEVRDYANHVRAGLARTLRAAAAANLQAAATD